MERKDAVATVSFIWSSNIDGQVNGQVRFLRTKVSNYKQSLKVEVNDRTEFQGELSEVRTINERNSFHTLILRSACNKNELSIIEIMKRNVSIC